MKKTEKEKKSGGSMKLLASDFADLEEVLKEGTEKVEDNLDQAQLVGMDGEEELQEEEEVEEITEEQKVPFYNKILFFVFSFCNYCCSIFLFRWLSWFWTEL